MAIINTFEKCLNSPYLSIDETAPLRVAPLLRLAADRLSAASNLREGGSDDPADVVLFAYESVFACLRALVYQRGYREAGLRCLLLACERFYVVPGLLNASFLHKFERIQTLQMGADEAIETATAWVAATLELVGASPSEVAASMTRP